MRGADLDRGVQAWRVIRLHATPTVADSTDQATWDGHEPRPLAAAEGSKLKSDERQPHYELGSDLQEPLLGQSCHDEREPV